MSLLSRSRRVLYKARSLSAEATRRHICDDAVRLKNWVNVHTVEATESIKKAEGKYETLKVSISEKGVVSVNLNRPQKMNAMNMKFWDEFEDVFVKINQDNAARVVVLGAEGRLFCSGMDLNVFAEMNQLGDWVKCEGRTREALTSIIKRFQNIISAPERCRVPVIASVSGPCIGGAVDLITACDIRLCDSSAEFSVKEIDLAIVADIGTLQRLPSVVGYQRSMEMALTGRSVPGEEAKDIGLVLECYTDKKELERRTRLLAESIADKSPLTARGVKTCLKYSREHSVEDSLNQVSLWNAAHLHSNDLREAVSATMQKRKPSYPPIG